MKKIFYISILAVLLLAGCASTIEPTAMPVQSNPQPASTNPAVAPRAVTSQTVQAHPVGNCQSRILGRILDTSGKLIKGATIDLRGNAIKGTPPRAVSDDNGLYGFAGLCAGSYSFTVTAPGKAAEALSTTVAVDGANTGKADLTVK